MCFLTEAYFFKVPEDIMYDDLSDQLAILGTKMVSHFGSNNCFLLKTNVKIFGTSSPTV